MLRPDPPPKWPRVVASVLAACLFLASCSSDDDPAEAATTTTLPPARTLLRVGVTDWPDCLNPLTCDGDGVLGEQILQHVLPVAMEIAVDGEPVASPLLARAPQIDGGDAGAPFTITYRLAESAMWNDGRPVTSSDFRATWLAVMATPGAHQGPYADVVSVDDSDPLVAVVELARPRADWADLFGGAGGWLLQGDAIGADLDLTGRFRDELPFSAGPFRLVAWDRDVAVLVADAEHWAQDRMPEIDQVRVERRSGERGIEGFDLVVPAADEELDDVRGFDTVPIPTTEVVGIWFDRRSPLLGAKAHRDALSAAIDRAAAAGELASSSAEPDVVPCLGWLPDVGPWCDPDDLPEVAFDPDLSRFALALEGWTAGEDGTLVRGGEPFAVTVTHDPALPGAEAVADELATRFADIGVAVSRGEIDAATWRSARAVDSSTGVGVFRFDLGVSPLVTSLYGCPDGPESSVVAWCPPDVVERARAMLTIADEAALLDAARQIGDVAAEDRVWVPLVRHHRPLLVRSDRVSVPAERSPVAGPLGHLHEVELG